METETGYVEVDGGRLYYEATGAGRPLVLVHGHLFDGRLWDAQAPVFARHYRVIRYDVLGFGRSEMRRMGPDVPDLSKLLDALGLERIYLLGLSMGAEIAHAFTLDHPEKVAALIEVGSGVVGWAPDEAFEQRWGRFFQAAETGDYDQARAIFAEVWVDGAHGQAAPEVRRRALEIMQDYSFGHFAPSPADEAEPATEAAAAPPSDDTPAGPTDEERLAEIRVPTLIMVGDRDQPAAVASADVLAAGIAGAQKVVIPGAAHIIPLEQPEAFNRAVLAFLGNLAA